MKFVITGAGGMLGQDLSAAAARLGHEVIAANRHSFDITDPLQREQWIGDERPDWVFNCAAWTDVDGAEDDEAGAMRVNDAAAAQLATTAAAFGTGICQVSTDYVFDGGKRRPYLESDLTGPINAYGRSKLAGETSVAVVNPRHIIARTSWLFGLGGRNFVETMLELGAREQEVLVVTDQVGSPTWTGHLAAGLLELVAAGERGIFHLTATGSCSWFEFAQEIFDQAEIQCDVLAANSEMMGRKATRPAYSVMRSERKDPVELPDWRAGLAAYLHEREPNR